MENALQENINNMRDAAANHKGMDYIIISTGDYQQQAYWQHLISKDAGKLIKSGAHVIAVIEDWEGGAGNGLGTLYAYKQACLKILGEKDIDLNAELLKGASVAIYHTAGMGKRLAPLSCSEHGNKPAIKIPGYIAEGETYPYVTILEAVIKQTAVYAPSRKGRLSVFWGDQIFIPSAKCDYFPTHHIDILGSLGPMPSKSEWEQRELSKYGLLAVDKDGNAKLIDKSTYDHIQHLVSSQEILIDGGVGVSLGSFSLSAPCLFAYLAEFESELALKQGKFDTDPHFWMPACLSKAHYVEIMLQKKMTVEKATTHYERVRKLVKKLTDDHSNLSLFGIVDVGMDCCWWDYGTIQSYHSNILKLLNNDQESRLMRQFYNLKPQHFNEKQRTCILNCEIVSQKIANSVLVGVTANLLDITNSVIVNSNVHNLHLREGLIYNVTETADLSLQDKTIRADVKIGKTKEKVELYSSLERNGEQDWNMRILSNPYSYEELRRLN